MKKDDLKKVLKPLIKECIKEVIFEEGTLSAIISEVVRGTSQTQQIVEVKREEKSNRSNKKNMEKLKQRKRKILDSIGKDAYNGVNLFEGTTPAPAASSAQGQGPLSGMAAEDAGVDISGIFSDNSSAIWKKLSRK